MSLRETIKKHLPSYRTEKRIMERMAKLEKDMREMDRKNEYLFWNAQMQPGETMQDAKARVCQRMPKATGRLRYIQLAEDHILKRVKKVCDENGLSLFLVGGTLLGAVRHKGFIPWDNDIDVGMMKADYLKLRELLKDDDELRVEYCYNYDVGLKISKVKFKDNEVFWIDILVFDLIDVTPDTLDDVWVATQKANLEHQKKIRELAAPYAGEKSCRPIINHAIDEEIAKFEAEQAKEFECFGHGDYFCEPINCPYWSRDERGIRKVSDYFPLLKEEVEFEGVKYDAWKNYDKALAISYGDIWKLPFSINEPHTTEFDDGLDEAVDFLRANGIID